MIKLGVLGVTGKMGRRIIGLAGKDRDFEVLLALEKRGTPIIGEKIGDLKISSNPDGIFLIDVAVDFTAAEASVENLNYVLKYKKALVLGTTGFNESQIKTIEEASKKIPIVFSANMSIGMNLLFRVAGEVASNLGAAYDIELVEAHHKAKKDAPSGTAKKLQQVLSLASGKDIPAHAIRAGDIIGDHTIIYAGNHERIEIKHQAHSRDVFAIGALKAAKWVAKKGAGLYTMQDVLGNK